MAARLKEFTPYKGRYPWPKWTDGAWWTVTKGDDFHCELDSFVSGLSQRAKSDGLAYEAYNKPKPNQITFRFLNADRTPIAMKRKAKSKPSK